MLAFNTSPLDVTAPLPSTAGTWEEVAAALNNEAGNWPELHDYWRKVMNTSGDPFRGTVGPGVRRWGQSPAPELIATPRTDRSAVSKDAEAWYIAVTDPDDPRFGGDAQLPSGGTIERYSPRQWSAYALHYAQAGLRWLTNEPNPDDPRPVAVFLPLTLGRSKVPYLPYDLDTTLAHADSMFDRLNDTAHALTQAADGATADGARAYRTEASLAATERDQITADLGAVWSFAVAPLLAAGETAARLVTPRNRRGLTALPLPPTIRV